jgi:hypothetical protein
MQNATFKSLAVFAVVALTALPGARAQDQTATPATAATPAPASAPPAPIDFKPGFDDLMTMLVQPRHLKLYYAGVHKNWELAAAESRDLRQALQRMAQTIPTYQGNDVDAAIVSIIAPKIQAVDEAIAKADSARFASAYNDLTTACTACHTYMEHPFIVIRVPEATGNTPFPNQDFSATP